MKHAASVRPEPGSNSPLSEKLCPSSNFAKKLNCSTSLIAFRYPIIAFWINKFSLSFLNSRLQLFCCQGSISQFMFSFTSCKWRMKVFIISAIYFRISISVLILRTVLWLLFLPHSDLLNLAFGQSVHSAVSSPNKFYLITSILFVNMFFWINLTICYIAFYDRISRFKVCYLYISALRWCPSI